MVNLTPENLSVTLLFTDRMKNKLFILIFILSTGAFAQLSDLHYLPPLKQGSNNQAIQQQEVHISTPETTTFTVNVYRGTSNAIIATFNISNTAPAVYTLANGDNNITLVDNAHTGVVITDGGLRFEAPSGDKFYVNYRGRSGSQGASLTSKGRAAMGTRFKWGGVPNLGTHVSKSNTVGIMATEDNTTIDIFGYDPNCTFRSGANATALTDDTYQITLNANESFVFEAYLGNTFSAAQSQGWIGASIVSDKNIVISNGSLNYGRQANNSNRDAGIDQPVPEDRIGKDYVFIRGNGSSNGWTEFPLIIATQNNTAIYVNGSTTPIATINNGDYFEIPSSYYSSNSVGANMYVSTSKDAYAYQCMGGSTAAYTQGLNFVAPVNCLLPDHMDNIPDIRNVAGINVTGGVTIVASTTTPDGNITVTDGTGNITLPPSSPVAGNSLWKTFYVPNLTGNVSVNSTGPIAVGFVGFNGARGVAGYFSGFDTVPDVDLQVTGGGCLPGSVIEVVDANFDAYQWFQDGTEVPGAIFSSFTPNQAGDYYVRVTKGGCTYDSQPIAAYYCLPDVVIKKTADTNTVFNDGLVTFTITVESLGVNDITNVVITDLLPTGLQFVSSAISKGSFTYPNWNIGTMEQGDLETISLIARANLPDIYTTTTSVTNTASNSQDQTDTNITSDDPSETITINFQAPTTIITNRRITYRVN
ncbi:putative repeat protein (TIGR01451 family) [Flavobacteriaceae bacterium MAR_2009_75]|nr:putative repeat protein (TIGR01451 family) [Flavobacteriaceae bacterium MAR_2009_75]